MYQAFGEDENDRTCKESRAGYSEYKTKTKTKENIGRLDVMKEET